MFEKYNASLLTEECSAGSGGEYEVQVIFPNLNFSHFFYSERFWMDKRSNFGFT
jgi:hypothetical protein